jgi:hypothetical protein
VLLLSSLRDVRCKYSDKNLDTYLAPERSPKRHHFYNTELKKNRSNLGFDI